MGFLDFFDFSKRNKSLDTEVSLRHHLPEFVYDIRSWDLGIRDIDTSKVFGLAMYRVNKDDTFGFIELRRYKTLSAVSNAQEHQNDFWWNKYNSGTEKDDLIFIPCRVVYKNV